MAQGNRIKIFQGRDPHTKFSANPLSLYHNEGCSYSYSSVRGSDTGRFPLSLLYHSEHVVFIIQLRTNILSSITFEKAYKIIE